MIPGAEGAAAVGSLLILLAVLLGVLLLSWWGWRGWNQHRGMPRPPLQAWQWMVAMLASVLPIMTALMWAQLLWSDYQRARYLVQQDHLRYFTLPQTFAWGDLALPAGTHAQRELLEGEKKLKGDASDLRTLTGARFVQPQPLGELSVNALGWNGDWLLLELARPHRFAKQDCPAGYTVQFKALKPRTMLEDVPVPIYEAQPLQMADWQFDSCFNARVIMMQHWKRDELVWLNPPHYGLD